MVENQKPNCSDCEGLDRRTFMAAMGGGVAALSGVSAVSGAQDKAKPTTKKAAKPAEALIKELHASLSNEQKQNLVYAWNHGAEKGGVPTRQHMVNRPMMGKRIGENYTEAQQELVQKILRAICSDDKGYQQISRNGKFDGSRSLQGCGAVIFGDPADNKPFAWVFSGHHLTIRCDGNSEPGAAFGGPMYYGHSPNGYSPNNVWFYQTKSVLSVFDALNEKQREKAVVTGKSPGGGAGSVKFRAAGEEKPGIVFSELTKDQKGLVETVMRTVISPYRKEDADEVMEIVKANGGMDKVHLAFYQDKRMNDNMRWHYWRLEGPGFVWNYRVLPHVHTFVNIAKKA